MSDLPAMTFGQFLTQRREQLGYKIEEISKKSGMAWASISAYEHDKSRPHSTNLYKLAKAYELTANDLEPYELKHAKAVKAKPVDKVSSAIKYGLKQVEDKMTGGSQFEQKMRLKLIEAFDKCEEILKSVRFLDDAF
jgi:transcriptional regulator with XRE-family HTH domain